MWFVGKGSLNRVREHRFKHLGSKGRAVWVRPPTSPYDTSPLVLDPFEFAYAAARSSIVGTSLGLRGQIAGLGLASAALAYLDLDGANGVVLHNKFASLKDFVGTSMLGTIGAAISYLEMLSLGYVWQGHWEDCISGPVAGSRPDFIFAKPNAVCLVDAKGTTSSPDRIVKDEWRRQIYSNRSVGLKFGGTADEGRVIATSLSTSNPAELVAAYGSFKKSKTPKPSAAAIASVQRGNFIDAFFLVGLKNLSLKLLGRRTFGELTKGATILKPWQDEEIYVGPARMALFADSQEWIMQAYCKRRIVDSVIRLISNEQINGMKMEPRQGGLISTQLENLGSVFVDGPDGVGAIFTPANKGLIR